MVTLMLRIGAGHGGGTDAASASKETAHDHRSPHR